MTSKPVKETIQDFTVIGLENDLVSLRVIPDLGSKVLSLVNRQRGREWMWRPPGELKLFRNQTGDGFANSTKIGADECLPTIEPCEWRGRHLPGHGEAWSSAWSWSEQKLSQGILATYLNLPVSPLEINRQITLLNNRIIFQYSLKNSDSEPYEFVWALHPLFTVHDHDRIILPEECDSVQTELAMGIDYNKRGLSIHWPCPEPGIDFSKMTAEDKPFGIKLFTDPLTQAKAILYNQKTCEYLAVTSDSEFINTIGIWINRGGWAGYHHVALETASGAPDSLPAAVNEWKRATVLRSGEVRRWQISWHLGVDLPQQPKELIEKLGSE